METKLERISQLSKENPNMVFTSIGHLINKEMLKKCHETMQKDKATGIDGKTRPLSIYCYEDKLVQEALRRILEAVYEPHFYDEMMGFRPNRSCHKALKLLNTMIEDNNTN